MFTYKNFMPLLFNINYLHYFKITRFQLHFQIFSLFMFLGFRKSVGTTEPLQDHSFVCLSVRLTQHIMSDVMDEKKNVT